MSNRGIQEFYYTRELPSRAVAIAKVATAPLTPAQLTDVNNTPYLEGSLKVWKSSSFSSFASTPDYTAPDLNVALTISGDTTYYVEDQFFELTNIVSGSTQLFFYHTLPNSVTDVKILDLSGQVVDAVFSISANRLYHDQDKGQAFRVRYVDAGGFMQVELLQYYPVLSEGTYTPGADSFVLSGPALTVSSTGAYYLRFIARNGYRALPPYDGAPNAPWFVRLRFPLKPPAPEWARQVFLPTRPYMLGVWVKGAVLDKRLVEFERKQVYQDPDHLPDILVFDKDYAIKYAIEGTTPGSPRRRGTLYPWKRGLFAKGGIDYYNARVELLVELDPTDIVFGFYPYREQDVIYRALDVNPFTNPNVKNRVVQFYFKNDGLDPFRVLYHQILDDTGAAIAGLTNDAAPGTGTKHVFATMVVGTSIGPNQFTITDIRSLGGGLSAQFQDIPEAVDFWDLGYWDGKPYPLGGALAVYLPAAILDRMTKADVEEKVKANLPMGVIPVIFYYDETGMESR